MKSQKNPSPSEKGEMMKDQIKMNQKQLNSEIGRRN